MLCNIVQWFLKCVYVFSCFEKDTVDMYTMHSFGNLPIASLFRNSATENICLYHSLESIRDQV